MSTIDPTSPLLAALQARLARPPAGARAPAAAPAAQARATPAAGRALAQRIAAIDPSDPDRRRKAVRVVLEAQLAREFGSAVLNDPVLPIMLDTVQQQMQADAQTAAAVHALGELLLAGAT